MTYEDAAAAIEEKTDPSLEAREKALDAISFVESLHQMFKDNGMTTKEEPDVDELENLIDALHGELGAAVLFLCENVFARVPDMLRVIAKQTAKDESVPPVISKGFERVAKRIENTRVNMQNLAPKPVSIEPRTEPGSKIELI